MQYCRIISLDNNNSVKFTSSRKDNSTTNDSMVMKIAHAQLHMYTNIMCKFQSSTCKIVGEKLRTKIVSTDRRAGGQTDGQPWRFQYTPSTSLWGYKEGKYSIEKEPKNGLRTRLCSSPIFFFFRSNFTSFDKVTFECILLNQAQ